MKRYLLLFFSTLLMLFALPKPDRNAISFAGVEQGELKKACTSKRPGKHTCPRKCLKHQPQQGQQHTANLATDCSQQFYAIVADNQHSKQPFIQDAAQLVAIPAVKAHQSPSLEADPDPPRFS